MEIKYYVKKQRPDIPVYVYLPNRNPVFYIGSVLFEESEIIDKYPENKKIWIITKDGKVPSLTTPPISLSPPFAVDAKRGQKS